MTNERAFIIAQAIKSFHLKTPVVQHVILSMVAIITDDFADADDADDFQAAVNTLEEALRE